MKKILPALVLVSLLIPLIGLAQILETPPESLCTEVRHDLQTYITGCGPAGANVEGIEHQQLCCVLDIMETAVDYVFVILLIFAGVMIIWGAFQFVTAAGAPEKVNAARDRLVWALVGIAVALAARGLVKLIQMLLT